MRRVATVLLWVLAALVVIGVVGWLALRRPDVPYETLEARYATPASRYTDLGGGIRVHYQDVGSGPVIVLLHGYGDSFMTWKPVMDRLAKTHRVIAPDLPGHGLTRAPASFKATPDAYVPVVDQFARALRLPPFTLVGNSMGGGVAWQYALAHPDQLSGLVLVDASGWPDETLKTPPLAFRILMSPQGRWWLKHMETRPITSQALQMDFHDPKLATPEFVNRWVDVQLAPGHREILMSLGFGPNSQATNEKLTGIKTPTLVLHGADDKLIDASTAQKFKAAIPGAQAIIYPKAGHLPQWEVPDAVARDISAFVARQTRPPAAANPAGVAAPA